MAVKLRSIRTNLAISFAAIATVSYGFVVLTSEFFIRNDRLKRHADLVSDVVGLVRPGLDGGLGGRPSLSQSVEARPLLKVLDDYSSVHALIWLNAADAPVLAPSTASVGRLQRDVDILRGRGHFRHSSLGPRFISEDGHTFLASGTPLGSTPYTLYVVEDIGLTPVADRESIRSLLVIWASVVVVSMAVVLLLIDRSLRPLLDLESALEDALSNGESGADGGVAIVSGDYPLELRGIIAAYLGLMDRLQHVLSQKQLILSAMSHELLSPIAVLLGWSKRLMRDRGQLSDGQQKLVVDIFEELVRFNHLTASLLQASKGSISLPRSCGQAFCPVSVVLALRDELSDATYGSRLRFVQGVDELRGLSGVACLGDKDLFRQCVVNLIENAVKYSPPASLIEVSCALQPENSFSVNVRDFGFGVGDVEQAKIFGPYYRSPGANAERPGSGVGLALVELLMKQMAGSVHLSESTAAGSVFTLILPVSARPL